ncbi:hypothetical protein GGR56DRAFT_287468 [Xylariaceae sp. FL0804]|nr:hypothetical protein GGR56DRAFT_287468 [Xylariaceae sp. FL0804]
MTRTGYGQYSVACLVISWPLLCAPARNDDTRKKKKKRETRWSRGSTYRRPNPLVSFPAHSCPSCLAALYFPYRTPYMIGRYTTHLGIGIASCRIHMHDRGAPPLPNPSVAYMPKVSKLLLLRTQLRNSQELSVYQPNQVTQSIRAGGLSSALGTYVSNK